VQSERRRKVVPEKASEPASGQCRLKRTEKVLLIMVALTILEYDLMNKNTANNISYPQAGFWWLVDWKFGF
jgi:hypothetical protein